MSLAKMVGKDFELPEDISENQLREVLIKAFEYLVEEDFAKLVQILYRADVDQDKLKALLENAENSSSAEVIADAYIARQKAKLEIWNKYSS
ncbi:hypothetical protein [Pedobacter helvus]|uniref:Uncharacterized protein n=1 Tax=Pedobacter helvus TaxID=2563444 RepID=A0ABW9JIE5_9SPHI|nr:hypothetical protein [Pedobacter ureilyticus]